MPNSLNFRRELKVVLLKQVGKLSKTFLAKTHNIPCIMRQSRIAARHSSGTWNSQGLNGRGTFQRCSMSQDRKNLLHVNKIHFAQ